MAHVGALAKPLPEPSLDALFAAHIEAVALRTARALEACGYSALLVHSGSLLTVFQDDRTYPFKVHAPFKVWAPLLDVPDCFLYFEPGRRPLLAFHQPEDYWYKPAALPAGLLDPALRDSPLPQPRRGAAGSARQPARHRLSGRFARGIGFVERRRHQSAAPPPAPRFLPRNQVSLRARVPAPGEPAGRPRPPRRRRAPTRPAPPNSRSSSPSSPPAASGSRSCPITPSSP